MKNKILQKCKTCDVHTTIAEKTDQLVQDDSGQMYYTDVWVNYCPTCRKVHDIYDIYAVNRHYKIDIDKYIAKNNSNIHYNADKDKWVKSKGTPTLHYLSKDKNWKSLK
jgi:hypothetical protein